MQDVNQPAAGQGQHINNQRGDGHYEGDPTQNHQSQLSHSESHMQPQNQRHHGDEHGHQRGDHQPHHGGERHGHEAHHAHGGHEAHHSHHDHNPQHHPVQFKVPIEVNGDKVVMHKECPTGLEVKQAALEQNVPIQLTFVLQVERANGTSDIIGDTDHVHLHPHQMFTAIAPDDNS